MKKLLASSLFGLALLGCGTIMAMDSQESNKEDCDALLLNHSDDLLVTKKPGKAVFEIKIEEKLLPAFKQILTFNHVYQASGFSKSESHAGFYHMFISENLFAGLSIQDLVELVSFLDHCLISEGIISSICRYIIEKADGAILDFSDPISPALIGHFTHYYYLIHSKAPIFKFIPHLHAALRYSIKELINFGHLQTADIKAKPDESKRVYLTRLKRHKYRLDLSSLKLNDLEGIEEIFKVIDPKKIVSLSLANNSFVSIDPSRLSECINLTYIDLRLNLFTHSPIKEFKKQLPNCKVDLAANPYRLAKKISSFI